MPARNNHFSARFALSIKRYIFQVPEYSLQKAYIVINVYPIEAWYYTNIKPNSAYALLIPSRLLLTTHDA